MARIVIPKSTMQAVEKQAIARTSPQYEPILLAQFGAIRQKMIQEFLNHPVTEEIANGPDSSNISGTLGGYGNLFSFIGFEAGSDPITPILEILESCSVAIETNPSVMTLILPSSDDIFEVTPMPWATGRSWAQGIERGIAGIGYYLSAEQKGRSEGGIQTNKPLRGGRFKNTSYISALINKYYVQFSQIKYASTKVQII